MEAASAREAVIKKAAELMRSGATMLAESCPLCGSPLFRLPSREVVCPLHGRVMLVKTEEEVAEANIITVLTELEKSITAVLSKHVDRIKRGEAGFEESRDVIAWLEAIERIERIKNMMVRERTASPGTEAARKGGKEGKE